MAGKPRRRNPDRDRFDEFALVDIDDTIKEVHGHQKQDAGFGYSGVCGLNALFAIISTGSSAVRPRRGCCFCAGAKVSITARLNSWVKAATSAIPDTAWMPMKYTNAVFNDTTG